MFQYKLYNTIRNQLKEYIRDHKLYKGGIKWIPYDKYANQFIILLTTFKEIVLGIVKLVWLNIFFLVETKEEK